MRFQPEEFIVEEITADGTVLELGKRIALGREGAEGRFTHFVLQKREWTTTQAISNLAKALHVSQRRFNYAGTKDRNAVTTQLCSVFGLEPDAVEGARVKDVEINGAWKAREKVRLGDLLGNRFTITLTKENWGEDAAEGLSARAAAAGFVVPNYFGSQRFGSLRENTHLVGLHIVKGELKEAAMNYLTFTSGLENQESTEARKRLSQEMDFKAALSYFPGNLKPERTLLDSLARNPTDFAGALRRLPRGLLLMFVHAVQSLAFNNMVKQRAGERRLMELQKGDFTCPAGAMGFPDVEKAVVASDGEIGSKVRENNFIARMIPGYDNEVFDSEREELAKLGLTADDFKIRTMPELSAKGALRPIAVPLAGFEARQEGQAVVARFSLPAGAYATVAISELLVQPTPHF